MPCNEYPKQYFTYSNNHAPIKYRDNMKGEIHYGDEKNLFTNCIAHAFHISDAFNIIVPIQMIKAHIA